MDSFQLTVLSIFVILAILLLVAFSLMITGKKDDDSEYPATYANCPDYWTMDANGNCLVPASGSNQGTNTGAGTYTDATKTPGYTPSSAAVTASAPGVTPVVAARDAVLENINFKDTNWNDNTTNPILKGLTGRCSLKAWANEYKVKWDGVNNYNSKFC